MLQQAIAHAAAEDTERSSVVIHGMHGMGDNLHQRAVVRQWMQKGYRVFLETPWPAIYHDMVGDRLLLVDKRSTLRTQQKNALREAAAYTRERIPASVREVRVSYSAEQVRRLRSVLRAMLETAYCDEDDVDFRLPIPYSWLRKADAWIAQWSPTKPIAVYRPLNERREWGGCKARNPHYGMYAQLAKLLKNEFFVVSVADFEAGKEWQVGEEIGADVKLHSGELDFEALAGLIHYSALTFSSPGFMVPLSQALQTPCVCVFGGYENSSSFSSGSKYSKYLGIDTVAPCQCWSHVHNCDKRIDMNSATTRIRRFAANCRTAAPRNDVLITAKRANLPPFPPRFFNAGELDLLVHLVGSVNPKTVIEFGCNEARAAATILLNVESIEHYVGIDVFPGYQTIKECQRAEVPTQPGKYAAEDDRFHLLLCKRGAFDLRATDLPECDAVFIDADHSRAGVLNDYALAKARTRSGGIIIFHDDNYLPVVEVSETLDELQQKGANIVHVANSWLAYERV